MRQTSDLKALDVLIALEDTNTRRGEQGKQALSVIPIRSRKTGQVVKFLVHSKNAQSGTIVRRGDGE